MRYVFALLAMAFSAAPAVASEVALTSEIFVERIEKDEKGQDKVVLAPPALVTPGDRLVFVISYKNGGSEPAADFAVTNPVPPAVAFAGSEDMSALLSVDGGKSWGKLNELKVTGADGSVRPAVAADVTHIRWRFDRPIAPGAAGKLRFHGTVK